MDTLRAIYEGFLARPDPALLATEMALHYIPTATSFRSADKVMNHLKNQNSGTLKKTEKVLNTVEGSSSLCVDVETKLELVTGGGAYLPGLDENFIVDRAVTFPSIHILDFDDQRKISQIRLYWDQASLLKQLEVIGSRHQSWPIRDGAEQIRLIASSIAAATKLPALTAQTSMANKQQTIPADTPAPKNDAAKRRPAPFSVFGSDDGLHGSGDSTPRKPGNTSNNPGSTRDKYNHFEFGVAEAPSSTASRRPKQGHFEFGEAELPISPSKPPKTETHFEFGEEPIRTTKSKEVKHFEFGEAPLTEATHPLPARHRSSKHLSQWDFDDFATPEKPKQKVRSNDVRHFGWSDDEPAETPRQAPRPAQPRRDAEPHFKFQDEDTPKAARKYPQGAAQLPHKNGHGLYENNLYSENDDTSASEESKAPPTNMPTNVNRRKDFDSHWTMTDEPSPDTKSKIDEPKHVSNARMKAVNMMGASWGVPEEDDDASTQGETKAPPSNTSTNINRKKNFDSHWDISDEPSPDAKSNANRTKHVSNVRMKAVKMMDSNWGVDEEDDKKESTASVTRAKRASRNVNQRSWGFGEDDL